MSDIQRGINTILKINDTAVAGQLNAMLKLLLSRYISFLLRKILRLRSVSELHLPGLREILRTRSSVQSVRSSRKYATPGTSWK